MKTKKSSIFWIAKNAKSQLPLMTILSVTSMISSASYVVPAFISKRVINAAVNAPSFEAAKPEIIQCAIYFLIFIVAVIGLMVLNSRLSVMLSGRLEMKMRHNFFKALTKKKYDKIAYLHSGDILNRFTSDIEIVVYGITQFVPRVLSIVTKIVVGVIVLASFSKTYALIMMGVGCLILICALLFKPWYKKIHKQVQHEAGVMRSFTQECVENITVVKSFSSRLPLLKKLDGLMQNLYKLKIFRNVISNIAGGGASFIYKAAYYATLCWGAFMIAGKSMDYGTLMAFMQIISQLTSPFFNASSLITQLYNALASAERLEEIDNLEDEHIDLSFDAKGVYDKMVSLSAENLSFKYDSRFIINNSTFSVKKGAVVAITGPSGIGKSTLFKILLGLYPQTSGRLYIKTEDGEIDIDSATRALFAYVPQGNLLISGTLRENIKFGNADISDEAMVYAAKAACIYDFIQTLPEGFDTQIRERGSGISEGQMQRIAVARALCCDAPILILDECTSALDSKTEEEMLGNISKMTSKMIFFISHKNATLSVCDTRLGISDGQITLC